MERYNIGASPVFLPSRAFAPTTKSMRTTILPVLHTTTTPPPVTTTTTTTTPPPATPPATTPYTLSPTYYSTSPSGGGGGAAPDYSTPSGGGDVQLSPGDLPADTAQTEIDSDEQQTGQFSGAGVIGSNTHWKKVKSYSRRANTVSTHKRRVNGLGDNGLNWDSSSPQTYAQTSPDPNNTPTLVNGISTGSPDQFVGYNLYAGANGATIYDSTFSNVLLSVPANGLIGNIWSWVKDKADPNKIDWLVINSQLPLDNSDPQQPLHMGFILNDPANFNQIALNTQVKQIIDSKKEQPSFLDSLSTEVKWGAGIGIGLILLNLIPRK